MTIDCCVVWKFVKSIVLFIWTIFWLVLVAASPIIWTYIVHEGPDWYVEHGWVREGSGTYIHAPSMISCILFDILFIVLSIIPNAK